MLSSKIVSKLLRKATSASKSEADIWKSDRELAAIQKVCESLLRKYAGYLKKKKSKPTKTQWIEATWNVSHAGVWSRDYTPIALPHPLFKPSETCLILQSAFKVLRRQSKDFKSVIWLKELKNLKGKESDTFAQELVENHSTFLCDVRSKGQIPRLFRKRVKTYFDSRTPLEWKEYIRQCVASTNILFSPGQCRIKLARAGKNTAFELAANALCLLRRLPQIHPDTWDEVKCISLRGPATIPLPIYIKGGSLQQYQKQALSMKRKRVAGADDATLTAGDDCDEVKKKLKSENEKEQELEQENESQNLKLNDNLSQLFSSSFSSSSSCVASFTCPKPVVGGNRTNEDGISMVDRMITGILFK